MSLQTLQEKQKKLKNQKILKDSKIYQSGSTKSLLKESIQLINKLPKTLSTRLAKMQKMGMEIYLDMNSTKKLAKTNTILREEFMMH